MTKISIGGGGKDPIKATVTIEYADGTTETKSAREQVIEIEFAGDEVTVQGDIRGAVRAEGNVACGNIEGTVAVEGSIACGNITGDVKSESNVHGGMITGDLSAEGHVQCGDVTGDVNAEGHVQCGAVTGDVKSEGDVHCGPIPAMLRRRERSSVEPSPETWLPVARST